MNYISKRQQVLDMISNFDNLTWDDQYRLVMNRKKLLTDDEVENLYFKLAEDKQSKIDEYRDIDKRFDECIENIEKNKRPF